MNEVMATGFWFTTGAAAALGVLIIIYVLLRLLIDVAIRVIDARRERRRLEARKAKLEADQREFAAKAPGDINPGQVAEHRRLREKYGMPPVAPPHEYPKQKPGITIMDGGWYRV